MSIFWPRRCLGPCKLASKKLIGKILSVSICVRKNCQCIPKVSRVMVILAEIFWSRHCLGQRKVAFDNFFVWIFSVLMCIQTFFTMYHMVEDLCGFPYFHNFCFGVALVTEIVAFGKRIS